MNLSKRIEFTGCDVDVVSHNMMHAKADMTKLCKGIRCDTLVLY